MTGIDGGIALLAAENMATGTVLKWFMANPLVRAGLDRAGVRKSAT